MPEESWFAQLRPCRWVLLAMQVWPVCERDGWVVFRKGSPQSLYALLAWTATAIVTCRSLVHWTQMIQMSGSFSLKAYFAFFLAGHTPLVVPLVQWTVLTNVARAFNHSHRFQADFRRVFGVPLRLGVRGKAMATGLASPLFGVTFTFWAHLHDYVPWRQFPTYEITATYLTILPGTWKVLVFGLETSAQQLLHQLTQVLRGCDATATAPTDAADTAERLREVRWLWLQLDHTARLWARAWADALAHMLILSMVTALLSVFGVTLPLLRGQALGTKQAGLLIALAHNCHNIYTVCTAGYRVRTQVRDAIVKELLKVKCPSTGTEAVACEEINKFLRVIEMQNTEVSLRGFVTLNRALMIKCAAILMTYLIVLLQFAYAKGAE